MKLNEPDRKVLFHAQSTMAAHKQALSTLFPHASFPLPAVCKEERKVLTRSTRPMLNHTSGSVWSSNISPPPPPTHTHTYTDTHTHSVPFFLPPDHKGERIKGTDQGNVADVEPHIRHSVVIQLYPEVHLHTHTHTHIHTHARARAHTHMHANAHTHTTPFAMGASPFPPSLFQPSMKRRGRRRGRCRTTRPAESGRQPGRGPWMQAPFHPPSSSRP